MEWLRYIDISLQNVNGETYRFYVSNGEGNDEHDVVIGNNDDFFDENTNISSVMEKK